MSLRVATEMLPIERSLFAEVSRRMKAIRSRPRFAVAIGAKLTTLNAA